MLADVNLAIGGRKSRGETYLELSKSTDTPDSDTVGHSRATYDSEVFSNRKTNAKTHSSITIFGCSKQLS